MKLRTKTLLIISVTLTALVAALYGVSRSIVQGGFQKVSRDLFEGFSRIETADAAKNTRRVTDALALRLDGLSVKAADWAMWDDTYRFVQDRNAAYRKSNLGDDALSALKINHLVILDGAGQIVFGRSFDLGTGDAGPLPKSLVNHLAAGGPLAHHGTPESVAAGVLMLPEDPLMVVSRPILTSEAKGPIRGAVIFARYLDDAEFEQLSHVTHLTIRRHRADAPDLPPDVREAAAAFRDAQQAAVRTLDEDTIAGYATVHDLSGRPGLHLRVDVPREIYKQGRTTEGAIRERGRVILVSLVASIAGAGIVLGGVMLLLLETSVLSRLTRLSRKAAMIGSSGDFSGRVEAAGRDEVAALGGSVNSMLQALETSHREIEARNAEMRLLMDTLPAGLLSLDEDLRVNPEHSRSAEQMLETAELVGRPYTEVLGLVGAREQTGKDLREFLDVMRQDLLPEDAAAGLNPCEELPFGGEEARRWLRLRYFNIHRQPGQTNHILVVLEDVTREKQLAAEVAEQEKENARLRAVAENPDLFRDFLVETFQILRTVGDLAGRVVPDSDCRPLVHEIFRGVHTIKGVSGSFGLHDFAKAASELETSLEPLRRETELSRDRIEEMRRSLSHLQAEFQSVVESSRKLLGEDLSLEGGTTLRVPLAEIKRQIAEVRDLQAAAAPDAVAEVKRQVLQTLRGLLAVPAKKGLARSVKLVPGLLERLGKDAEFRFDGQDTPVDCEVASELNTPLVHLIRNAFDHGLETLEERFEAGKEERGRVCLAVARRNGHLDVVLEDDGRGMDPERLKQSALRKGVISPEEAARLSAQEALSLIFRPGFSTAEQVTDVSGRGVGMDAVLASVRTKLGGDIFVSSEPGRGTKVTISVPAEPPT